MPMYYMLLDAPLFHRQIVPALAASWRERSFEPCRPLCRDLVPAARDFASKYHIGPDELLLAKVARDLPFDRHYWQLLVGEVLLVAAAELPEVPTTPETLCCLLAAHLYGGTPGSREGFAPIEQAHFGTHYLLFGAHAYRPEDAGYNDVADVTRLADYLEAQEPARWTVDDLAPLRDAEDEWERAEELEIAREWFPVLRGLFRWAQEQGRVIVCERL
jgi:hypothetical protein